MESNMVKENG